MEMKWIILVIAYVTGTLAANTATNNSSFTPVTNCQQNLNFLCVDKSKCISIVQFCNGIVDCNDGSDEVIYNASIHSNLPGRSCARMHVTGKKAFCYITKPHVCNDEIDCFFGNDECGCSHTYLCDPAPFQPKACRVRVQFCNLIPECPSGSDEIKYAPGRSGLQCAVTKSYVTNHCMLPEVHVCDGTSDCDEGTDECFCNATGNGLMSLGFLNSQCFRCLDSSTVITNKRVCDRKFHCQDLSDECLCFQNRPAICDQVCQYGYDCGNCSVGQIICSQAGDQTQKCIDRTQVCNRQTDCPNKEDEKNCAFNANDVFSCADGLQIVEKYMRCDNNTDCLDGSDEWNCTSMYQCRRPGYSKTKPWAFLYTRPGYATKCDNIIECNDLDDECNKTLCPNSNITSCSYIQHNMGFICPNSGSGLTGKEICDGYPTCNTTDPDLSADEHNCTNRFYCADNGKSGLPIHIRVDQHCDQITDCKDVSDEMGCNTSTHFYCASGSPKYIPRIRVCNGIQECANGEDECQNCATSPFSSDSFMISSYVLQAIIWITAFCAVFGNSAVIFHNTKEMLKSSPTRSSIGVINRMLVLNLAVADFLLGVYLMGLASVNQVYAGIYCRRDVQWRGSIACSALGSLAVISTQVSVFTLAIMSGFRLFAVYRPFSHAKKRVVVLVIAVAWLVAVILAFVPLTFHQRDYFVSGIWYQDSTFLTKTLSRAEIEQFVTRLQTFQNQTTMDFTAGFGSSLTWTAIVSIIAKLQETLLPQIYFGYYSAHGVCLPRLFPNRSIDRSWGYSLMIIVINFCAFICMVSIYFTIFRKSRQQARKAGRKESSTTNLQRKITRIVVTNFCCWIPICIMAFISVAGVTMTKESYAVAAIVLLPINSGANPFLYSDLPDILWKKLKPMRNAMTGIISTTEEQTKSISGNLDTAANNRSTTTIQTPTHSITRL